MTDTTDPTTDSGIPEEVEAIQTEAKKTFSLKDRLLNISGRTKRVPLFTNIEAVDAYNRMNEALNALTTAIAKATDETYRATLMAQFEDGESKLEELKIAMLEGAISVHLRALPNVAVKTARRLAKQKFALPDGTVPIENQDNYLDFINTHLLQQGIERIVDSSGNEIPKTDTTAQELSDLLPPSQFGRLDTAFQSLTFTDQLGKAATDEPGF